MLHATRYTLRFQHREPLLPPAFSPKGKRKGRYFLEDTEFHRDVPPARAAHPPLRGGLGGLLLFLLSATLTAQTVKLNYNDEKNKETVRVQLFDSYNGDFLMELPLTFHITEDYILFLIIGDETGIKKNTAICLFDETMELNDLTKKNRNFTFSDNFKKYHKKIYPFFERVNNVEMMMPFQNHCEYIETTPKPLFFQIKNKANSIDLKLRFYLADISNKEKSGLKLIAESGTIKTTINIIK